MELHDPRFPGAVLSDDPARVDFARVHAWLTESYWARGIARERVERAASRSLVFGVYDARGQVAYARVVSDFETFAWLCDVIVDPGARGRGYGKWLVEAVRAHPELQRLRRVLLGTVDAHGLYEQYGFVRTKSPERFMEIVDPEAYTR